MPDILDKTQVATIDQVTGAVYVGRNITTTPVDGWMEVGDFHKSRSGNENVLAYADLAAAVTAIGSTQATIEIPATTTVSASLTIPANITLYLVGQGLLSVSISQTLTINGPLIAPKRQIFTGSGTVKFGGRVGKACVEWFGTAGDNATDDAAAIQKAIDAFKDTGIQHHPGIVEAFGGYAIGSTLLITGNSVTLRGSGWGVQNDAPYRGFIRWIGSAGTPMIKITECWMSGVENIRLIGKSSAKPTAAIELASTNTDHGLDFSFVKRVYIGSMFGYDTDDAIQFDAGILLSGTVDGDTNILEHIQVYKGTVGIDIQNGNASITHLNTVTIGGGTTGLRIANQAHVIGTNLFFALNTTTDILLSGDGAKLTIHEMGSEESARMAQITGNGAQLIVRSGNWGAQSAFTPADTGSLRWFIDGTDRAALIHLEDFELVNQSALTPVVRIGNTGGGGSSFLKLENTNLSSANIRTEPNGLNFLANGLVVESTQRSGTGAHSSIFSRCILDYTRTTEDRDFQPYRFDLGGKVNVFGGPLKVKQTFKPTGVTATAIVGSGATTYSYRVSALTYDGETEVSTAATCTNAATLDSTHKNQVDWTHTQGNYAYNVYGRSSGTELLLATVISDQLIAASGGVFWIDDGSLTPSGALPTVNTTGNLSVERMLNGGKGADVASAATIIPTGNVFHVTGTTTITSVSGANVTAGTEITIIFDGILTFTDGSNLKLNGNFVTSADDVIKLCWDGSNWFEVSRSAN